MTVSTAMSAAIAAATCAVADAGAPLAFATRFTASAFSLSPGAVMQSAPSTTSAAHEGDSSSDGSSETGSAAGDGAASGASSAASGADGLAPRPKFGQEGMVTFNVFGDFATDFDENWMAGGQFGISWFFVDDLSLDVQLEQWGISQEFGKNAYAIGPAMLLRWHFLPYESWSLYADAGCGFFYATHPVPYDGSRFNFTPRVGIGASIAITESARVMTGIRWFHISNANTSTPNPGRDSLELYAGLSLPF